MFQPSRNTLVALASPKKAPLHRLTMLPREMRFHAGGGEVVVVPVSGAFDAASRKSLNARVRNLLRRSQRRIAVDFSDVTELDRGAVTHLVRLYENARAARGSISLVNLAPDLRAALEARGLGYMLGT